MRRLNGMNRQGRGKLAGRTATSWGILCLPLEHLYKEKAALNVAVKNCLCAVRASLTLFVRKSRHFGKFFEARS